MQCALNFISIIVGALLVSALQISVGNAMITVVLPFLCGVAMTASFYMDTND